VQFLNKSQAASGGFLASPTSNSTSADVISTYYGLKALDLSGNLSIVNMSLVNDFLISCKNAGNLFGTTPNATQSSLIATAMAVSIYTEFLTVEKASVITGDVSTSFVAFLTSNAGPDGGFCDPSMSSIPLVSLTAYAIKTCNLLAVGVPGGNDLAINWILSKQQQDGGFINGAGGLMETSSMMATRHAVEALVAISADLAMLNGEVPWSLFPIGAIVAVIVIACAIIAILLLIYFFKKRNQL
nr:terpene cyclase/mutase family protein [Candidatus Sigynarchaeota archaeon]